MRRCGCTSAPVAIPQMGSSDAVWARAASGEPRGKAPLPADAARPWLERSTSALVFHEDLPRRLWALRLEVVMLFEVLAVLGGAALAAAAVSLRVVKQHERGLVFRFGRVLDQVRALV